MQTPSRAGKKYARLPMKTKVSKSTHTRLGSLVPFKNGRGLLHRAVELRHAVLLDFMLQSDQKWTGFDANVKDQNSRSPLSIALAGPQIPIIKILYKYGATLQNIPASVGSFAKGDSILFQTINLERFTSAQFLIDQMGASPFAVDLYGNNLLHLLLNKLPKQSKASTAHVQEHKWQKRNPSLPLEEFSKKVQSYEEASALAHTLCNIYGYKGINYLNNNELTPLQSAVKKNKEQALDFALTFNEMKRKEQEHHNQEILISTLQKSRTPLYSLNFSNLVSQIKQNEAPPFDFNVLCGRRNQSVIHFLTDVENYPLLLKIVNSSHVIEELDMHCTDSQFNRAIDIPVIRTPVHKLLQFVEREQSRRVRYSSYHKLKHYVELFYGESADLVCPLWNRRSPLPPVALLAGVDQAIEKLQSGIQIVDTGSSLQSEWLLRIKERIVALDVNKQISLMKTPSFKSEKQRRLPSRFQIQEYLKSVALPRQHKLFWFRGEARQEETKKNPEKKSPKKYQVDKRKPSLTIQDFRVDTPPLLQEGSSFHIITTPTIYPEIDLDEGVHERKVRECIKQTRRESQLARRSGRWSNWYKFNNKPSNPNFHFEMTPQIKRKENYDSPPPSTERAPNFSESPPPPQIHLNHPTNASIEISIVRTLFPTNEEANDSYEKDTVLYHEDKIEIDDILSERINSPQGLQRVINENRILKKHDSVTRKLDFKIKSSSTQIEEIPGYTSLVQVLSRKEDKLGLFEFMREKFQKAKDGDWNARQLLEFMANDKRRVYIAREAQHLCALL